MRNDEPILTTRMEQRLASVDSMLQLDLEIALSGVSAKVKSPNRLLIRPKVVKTSGDVITDDFNRTADSRALDLSPMRLGAAKDDPLFPDQKQIGLPMKGGRLNPAGRLL